MAQKSCENRLLRPRLSALEIFRLAPVRLFTGCRTAAAGGAGSLSLRRSCQGTTTLSQSSRVPMMLIAMPKGIRKYRIRYTTSVASNCSRPNSGSATSIAASNTPMLPGAWLAKPSRVARMNTTASEMKLIPGSAGIRRYIASAQNPRSTTPIRICSSVSRAEGNTTFQPFCPSSRRFLPITSQMK